MCVGDFWPTVTQGDNFTLIIEFEFHVKQRFKYMDMLDENNPHNMVLG